MKNTTGDRAKTSRSRDAGLYAEATLDPEDRRFLAGRIGSRGSLPVRIRINTDDDTEGHGFGRASSTVHVRIAADELDLEGHAFALHFPTIPDADAFKRGVAAGAIAATLLLGGVAGAVAVSESHAAPAANAPAAAVPAAPSKPVSGAPVINIRWGTGRAIPQ